MSLSRLALKILAVFVPLVLVAELVAFGFQAWRFYSEQQSELIVQLDNLFNVEASAFASPVWEFDTDEIDALASQIEKLSYVESLALYDLDGSLLAAKGDHKAAPKSPEFRRQGDIVFVEQGKPQVVGKLVLTVHDTHINAALAEYARFNGLILITLSVALIGSTLISTRLFIGRPLGRLQAAIEREQSGRSRRQLDWESADEIGVVVRAYNAMQTYQEAADKQIEAYQSHLEDLVEERTAEIRASIEYASHIQRSVLPAAGAFDTLFSDHFVVWEPRDVVGGDIYWLRPWGDGMLLVLGDCTGHGVPGAFMTMIATGALERAQTEVPAGNVAGLVQRMHQFIRASQMQDEDRFQSRDGMELGACYFNGSDKEFAFCGARFSIFVAASDGISEVKGGRKGIGYSRVPAGETFETVAIPIKDGHSYYLTTDGFIDQIGGDRKRSFGKRRFMETIVQQSGSRLPEQARTMMDLLREHQGDEKRLDDIAVIGFRF